MQESNVRLECFWYLFAADDIEKVSFVKKDWEYYNFMVKLKSEDQPRQICQASDTDEDSSLSPVDQDAEEFQIAQYGRLIGLNKIWSYRSEPRREDSSDEPVLREIKTLIQFGFVFDRCITNKDRQRLQKPMVILMDSRFSDRELTLPEVNVTPNDGTFLMEAKLSSDVGLSISSHGYCTTSSSDCLRSPRNMPAYPVIQDLFTENTIILWGWDIGHWNYNQGAIVIVMLNFELTTDFKFKMFTHFVPISVELTLEQETSLIQSCTIDRSVEMEAQDKVGDVTQLVWQNTFFLGQESRLVVQATSLTCPYQA